MKKVRMVLVLLVLTASMVNGQWGGNEDKNEYVQNYGCSGPGGICLF